MNDDEKEAIAQEVLKEDANHERGERPEWQTHEGWHRREDTGRFGTAARARAAERDAEAKKKKLYHEGWEAEADASAEALMARPVRTPPPSLAPRDDHRRAYYVAGAAAAALVGLLCYYRRRRRRRRGGDLHLSSSAELLVDLEEAVVEVVGASAPKND